MNFNVILAVDSKNGIGKNNTLPWNFSDDLKFFKSMTSFSDFPNKINAVIMGRKTYQTLGISHLPNRLNIVISSKQDFKNDFIKIASNFDEALELANQENIGKIWVIGGSQIYNLAFDHILLNKIYITKITNDFSCDTFVDFPKLDIINETKVELYENKLNKKYNVTYLISKRQENAEQKYLLLLKDVLNNGPLRPTRNANTFSVFNKELTFDIENEFPLLTSKRMFWRGIVEELLFFIRGDVNTKNLEEKNINIWKGNTSTEFLNSHNLNYQEGIMGPMYGYQWRFFNKPFNQESQSNGIDQLQNLIDLIKTDPHSRRLLMTDFNPEQADQGVLYPCHSLLLQFYVEDNKLSVKMYQRSADLFLGLPFNIASTSLLLMIIAKLTNKIPSKVSITLGDCHIYETHTEAVLKQLTRKCYDLPSLKIPDFKTIEEVENSKFEDYNLENYNCNPGIKAEMIA